MRQILHIFQKDARHYWPEAAVSLALLVVFGSNEVSQITDEVWAPDVVGPNSLLGLVAMLLPLSWSYLIARVIHGESLVGDRQFWVTRPYEWKKLLAAKILYVITFINLPLLAMDAFVLARAGFPPLAHLGGLVWMQILIVSFFLLPVVALAAVTSTTSQVFLAMLVIALYSGSIAALQHQIPSSSIATSIDWLLRDLFILTIVAVILWQYARRRTNRSRQLIGGFGLAVCLVVVGAPYKTLVAHEFPELRAGQSLPVAMSILATEIPEPTGFSAGKEESYLQLTLGLSGLQPESIAQVEGVLIEIEGPDGSHWDAGWKSRSLFIFPDQAKAQIGFTLKKGMFERIKSVPVKLRVSLALTLFREKNRREFIVPAGEFALAGLGLCSAGEAFSQQIHCRAPMRSPAFLLVSADMSSTTCPIRGYESPAKAGVTARGWTRSDTSGPAGFGISPIKRFDLYLSDSAPIIPAVNQIAGICPGSRLVLSNPEVVDRSQTTLEMDGVRIGNYELK